MEEAIEIVGAKLHNLKNLNVSIPRNQLVVITGLSGSGKSSLAFDTLYAEGQRRYVESLSSYARQFLGRLNKPEVDQIKGIAPAIAIEQKVNTRNPRSTVGTSTEIYDYLKLLFARVGKTISPVSGKEVKRDQVSDVLAYIQTMEADSRFMIAAPISKPSDRSDEKHLEVLQAQGFSRMLVGNEVLLLDDLEGKELNLNQAKLIIDRVQASGGEDHQKRLADSIETAFFEGKGTCYLLDSQGELLREFNHRFEADGIQFEAPTEHLFSFNNPVGACPKCEGYGSVIGIDPDLVIPNTGLSIYEDAVVCWKGEKMQEWKEALVMNAYKFDFPIHTPYHQLSPEQQELVWNGNEHFEGIHSFFQFVESNAYKIQYRVMLSRYRGKTKCDTCKGNRLKPEAMYVQVGGYTMADLIHKSFKELELIFEGLELNESEATIAKRLLKEIQSRISFINKVGLSYLNLNRLSSTLSGGESQRINLATSLGSSLVGSMYILDEPSIGLHPRDTSKLIEVLRELRDLGNTVIVVEHEEEIIRAADHIIDIGPEAGSLGGELVFTGTHDELKVAKTLTAEYINGKKQVERPGEFDDFNPQHFIEVKGARQHNLKNIDVQIPLAGLCAVTGVSGSGKSTLIREIVYPALKRSLEMTGNKPGQHDAVIFPEDRIAGLEFVDQNPIGKSSRSNPVTYIKAYDEIRALFSNTQAAKQLGLKPKHFSFNVEGGRCPECEGEGTVTIGMQFMADIELPCEVCNGQRFKPEVLSVKLGDKNIAQLLDMTIDDAIAFFQSLDEQKVADKLKPLQDVGLGYIHVGQSSSTLSGGEAQRVKLASFLGKGSSNKKGILFIFDEPTTGLHFHDVNKLLTSFDALIAQGHSIIVIEHNMDVIRCSDWIIDLGPEGGDQGGNLMYCGRTKDFKTKDSYTYQYLD